MQQRPAYIYACICRPGSLSWDLSQLFYVWSLIIRLSHLHHLFSLGNWTSFGNYMIRGSYFLTAFFGSYGWSIGSQDFDCKNNCELLVIVSSLLIGWSSWCIFHPPYWVIKLVCLPSHLVGWFGFIDLVSISCLLIGWSWFSKPAITAHCFPTGRFFSLMFLRFLIGWLNTSSIPRVFSLDAYWILHPYHWPATKPPIHWLQCQHGLDRLPFDLTDHIGT